MGKSIRHKRGAIETHVHFGPIGLTRNETVFYRRFNREVLMLCRSLPRSFQTKSVLFLMEYLGLHPGEEPDFFLHYYPPAWSVVYWLTRGNIRRGRLSESDVRAAVSAHSMAMLLHLLDDHVNDGELPANHLVLVLRSQSWSIMNDAFHRLASRIPSGMEIVRSFLDEYCKTIGSPGAISTVDLYCEIFRGQMATWTIVPLLLAKCIDPEGDFYTAVRRVYESFGIAWRLVDDIQDIRKDMERGTHTSVYLSLAEEMKCCWDEMRIVKGRDRNRLERLIHSHVLEGEIIHGLKRRICRELDFATSKSALHGLAGLAAEFQSLARPLKSELKMDAACHGPAGASLAAR
jgi:hypothetical protein